MSTVADGRPWRRAWAWLALLGPLFFLSYGFANHWAARQPSVPSVVFPWEARIPFWSWSIVPYWSIDLFYALSLFVCRSRRELDTHALRLLTAQIIAVACFLAWPLRFSFNRPETDGVFGWLFDVLLGFDKPYNQAPSLHIVLLVVLWVRWVGHAHGVWRWLLHGWFALIGLSVLTTFQHHFIDIPTGLLVGWLCVWLWPEDRPSPWETATWAAEPQRWRLAAVYLLAALACAAMARSAGGAAWWVLWPAVSLVLVSLNYALLGPSGFQKRADGRLSLAASWLLAPYLAAAWLNSRWWTRAQPRPREVINGVWLGRIPAAGERGQVSGVLDICAELPRRCSHPADRTRPMLDLVAPPPGQLAAAAADIEALRGNGPVLVCCALGYSRSAAVVAAWLLRSGRAESVDAAIALLRQAQPKLVLGDAHRRAISEAWAAGIARPAMVGA